MNKYSIRSEQEVKDFNALAAITQHKQVGILPDGIGGLDLYLDSNEMINIDSHLMPLIDLPEPKYNPILYGKNSLEGIVGAESDGENLTLFIQRKGIVEAKVIPNRLWVTTLKNFEGKFTKLEGQREYRYIRYYKDREKWDEVRKLRYKGVDLFASYCPIESNFISRGFTFFKGLQIKDISVLSFDIETDGLAKTENSDIYLISNTFRNGGELEHKLFDYKNYETRKKMLDAWCAWVREKDPSLLIGHNIYGYDFPYLQHVASLNDVSLDLGRDSSALKINAWPSRFRKDGNEQIEYFKAKVWGREIVDTFFLSYKYDVGRTFESNALKQIIKQLGLEKKDRTFVDAGKIRMYLDNPEMYAKICQYAIEDAQDALTLFDLMTPAFFYAAQLIPKKFEDIINGASGSQLNSMLVRAYLQDGKSIPRATERQSFQGAISMGIPGIYRNTWKIDAVQLYPSVMIAYGLYDPAKDPENLITYCLKEFMRNRRYYRALHKETGEDKYDGMQNCFKIFSNSVYGFLGAPGLNFNCPRVAAKITELGREVLNTAMVWATGRNSESWGYTAPIQKEDEDA